MLNRIGANTRGLRQAGRGLRALRPPGQGRPCVPGGLKAGSVSATVARLPSEVLSTSQTR